MKKNTLLIVIIGVVVIIFICITVAVFLLTTNFRTNTTLPPTLDLNTAIAEIADSFTATPQPTDSPTANISSTPRSTRTPLPTWTITTTPSPFPTRTPFPSITPTRATQKPGQGLGDPTWIDEFDTANSWSLIDDECFKTDISDGKYIQTTKGAPAGACWEITWPRIQDYYLETIARVPGQCEERDRYGIYFRGVDTRRGYLFGITCKGEYWLSFWNSNTSSRVTLIDYTDDEKINTGAGHANKLGIQTTGDRITLYVNDALLAEVYDSTYTQDGLIGIFIGSQITEDFTVKYDYLAYWANP